MTSISTPIVKFSGSQLSDAMKGIGILGSSYSKRVQTVLIQCAIYSHIDGNVAPVTQLMEKVRPADKKLVISWVKRHKVVFIKKNDDGSESVLSIKADNRDNNILNNVEFLDKLSGDKWDDEESRKLARDEASKAKIEKDLAEGKAPKTEADKLITATNTFTKKDFSVLDDASKAVVKAKLQAIIDAM